MLVADGEPGLAPLTSRYLSRTYRTVPPIIALNHLEETLRTVHLDVVVLDALFPNGDSAVDLIPDWCRVYQNTAFIIRTAYPDDVDPMQLLWAGVLGYLLKPEDDGLNEVGRAVHDALNGRIYISPRAHQYIECSPLVRRPFW